MKQPNGNKATSLLCRHVDEACAPCVQLLTVAVDVSLCCFVGTNLKNRSLLQDGSAPKKVEDGDAEDDSDSEGEDDDDRWVGGRGGGIKTHPVQERQQHKSTVL